MKTRIIKVKKKQCIGVKFRCRSSFTCENGKYKKNVSFTMLKRKSCKGCDKCKWTERALSNYDVIMVPGSPINFRIYSLEKLEPYEAISYEYAEEE